MRWWLMLFNADTHGRASGETSGADASHVSGVPQKVHQRTGAPAAHPAAHRRADRPDAGTDPGGRTARLPSAPVPFRHSGRIPPVPAAPVPLDSASGIASSGQSVLAEEQRRPALRTQGHGRSPDGRRFIRSAVSGLGCRFRPDAAAQSGGIVSGAHEPRQSPGAAA